ncbi:unnamed protein product [Microthlaspi erraticum]|uniref:Uncharacterized protein n=1 Tax=Microthlaspi erraticum TaxID=1685480 RepID=A0A6D2JHR5_9BRAS|nr:unnamed protein product [Microthlaspi erraticum]
MYNNVMPHPEMPRPSGNPSLDRLGIHSSVVDWVLATPSLQWLKTCIYGRSRVGFSSCRKRKVSHESGLFSHVAYGLGLRQERLQTLARHLPY